MNTNKTIDLSWVFNQQKLLDAEIAASRLAAKNQPVTGKIFALLVELGEFANEGKEFKYWSLRKHQVSKEKMLEEYIDCLHFLTTVAIHYDVSPIVEYPSHGLLIKLDLLKEVFYEAALLLKEKNLNKKNVEKLYQDFIGLGVASGFSPEDILKMYEHKNQINFERLKSGY